MNDMSVGIGIDDIQNAVEHIQIDKILSSVDDSWIPKAKAQLQLRNSVQTYPFVEIYKAYELLWQEHRKILQQHVKLQHQIAILQHEILEELQKGENNNSTIDNIKLKLQNLQEESKRNHQAAPDEVRQRLQLLQRINDQEKTIFDLNDELMSTKLELESSRGSISTFEIHSRNLNTSLTALRLEVESLRTIALDAEKRARKCEEENADLVNRFMNEKLKYATEMNEMNKVLTSKRGSISDGFKFMKVFQGTSGTTKDRTTSIEQNTLEDDSQVDVRSNRGSMSKEIEDNYVTEDFAEARRESIDMSVIEGVRVPQEPLRIVSCHKTEINDCIYNKYHLVTACADSSVNVYDSSSKQIVHRLCSGGPVFSVDISDDMLAGASSDKCCRIWSLSTGRLLHNLASHSNKVYAAKFIGDGSGHMSSRHLVTGSADRCIRIWQVSQGRSSPQSKVKQTMTTNSSVLSVAVSGDGNTAISGHQDGGLRLWDVATGNKLHVLHKLHASHITCVQFSPRRSGGRSNMMLSASRDNVICLLDTLTNDVITTLRSPTFRLSCDWSKVSFSPDGVMVAAGSSTGALVIWDVGSGSVIKEITGHHTSAVDSVYWGRAGISSCDKDGKVIFWS